VIFLCVWREAGLDMYNWPQSFSKPLFFLYIFMTIFC